MKKISTTSINYLLYERRLFLKYSKKEAATLLGISSLHLSLIEKGYLNVSKKLKAYFILVYQLKDDFFDTHTTFITPIDHDEDNINNRIKFRKTISKVRFKVIAYISVALSLGLVTFGVYGINRRFITPRVAWSEKFTDFYEKMRGGLGKPEQSVLDQDTVYKLIKGGREFKQEIEKQTVITSYEKETNAMLTNIDFGYYVNEKNQESKYVIKETYDFYLFSYNKKKIIIASYTNTKTNIVIPAALFTIGDTSLNLRPFNYTEGGVSKRAKKDNENKDVFNQFNDKAKDIIVNEAFYAIRDVFNDSGLPYVTTNELLDDLHVIARDASLFNRIGVSFIIVFSFTCILGIVLGTLSYYASYKLKPKKEVEEFPSPIISRDIPVRNIYNDINHPFIIPEFVVRAIGLTFLAISSVALFLSVYSLFNADFGTFIDVNNVRKLVSNFLVSAVLLLFFVKLDVFARKSSKALLINIIMLFIGGLMYYIIGVLMYRAIVVEGNIFSTILQVFTQIIPGNVVWNIMLYSMIFFFLFTLPKKYATKPAKILTWRLCSLIPTTILFFALFYKVYLEKMMIGTAFYVSFLFHTSGVITTLFAVFYIYSLYFLRLYNKLLFGEKIEQVYSYSRRFTLEKNILASIIILILFGIDMFFRFKVPNNELKLGTNWSIATLIPFIMLYRPHIGKRNANWDKSYNILYGLTFAGGYVAVAFYILVQVNISDVLFILF